MVKLRDADLQNYPHLCGYIRTDFTLAPGLPSIWLPFLNASGMSELTARDSINGGTRSPLMIVSALQSEGDFQPEFPDDVELSMDLAIQFETDFLRKEAQSLVQSVLLSQIVAWRRAMTDGPGWQSYRSQFLKDAYGNNSPARYWGMAHGTNSAVQLNAVLAEYAATGASIATASPEGLTFAGVAASRSIAQHDEPSAQRYRDRFEAAGMQYNIPPALLCGIASRESHLGASLSNGWGDNGNAFGIMQIDKRANSIGDSSDPAGQNHINYATSLLYSHYLAMQTKFAASPRARQLQAAVAAYNFGDANAKTLDSLDVGSTHDDYSNDVWARAQYFTNLWSS